MCRHLSDLGALRETPNTLYQIETITNITDKNIFGNFLVKNYLLKFKQVCLPKLLFLTLLSQD